MKYGRHGPFLSCARYPECKNAQDFVRDENGNLVPSKVQPQETDETCEKCGLPDGHEKREIWSFSGLFRVSRLQERHALGGQRGRGKAWLCRKGMRRSATNAGRISPSSEAARAVCSLPVPTIRNARTPGLIPPELNAPSRTAKGNWWKGLPAGVSFTAAASYPKCRYTLRTKPVLEKCPQCDNGFLVEAPVKDSDGPDGSANKVLKCPGKGCDYSRPMDTNEGDAG